MPIPDRRTSGKEGNTIYNDAFNGIVIKLCIFLAHTTKAFPHKISFFYSLVAARIWKPKSPYLFLCRRLFFFSSRNETNFAVRIFETIPVELFRHYAEKLQFSMHIT